MARWVKGMYNLFADFGDWLDRKSRNGDNAIILGILAILSPLGMLFSWGFIASSNRKRARKK